MLRMRVTLLGCEPEVWRLLLVREDIRLDALHQVLQTVFGWQNLHLNRFWRESAHAHAGSGPARGTVCWVSPHDPDWLSTDRHQTEHTLAQALDHSGSVLMYEYDYGDRWLHRMEVVDRIPVSLDQDALLVDGANAGPLEDSGGPAGHNNIVWALAHPDDPETAWLRRWAASRGGARYDPTRLDVAGIDAALAERQHSRSGDRRIKDGAPRHLRLSFS